MSSHMTAVRSLCALSLVALAACGDADRHADMDIGENDTLFAGGEARLSEGDEFAALTENGAVKLGLTRDRVYFEVSEAVRQHVDGALEKGIEESESRIRRSIVGAIRRGLESALQFEIDFRVDEIEDVDYRDGEIVFRFVDGGNERSLENIDIDGEPLTRSFSEEDARAFVAAFRRVKAGESARGVADPTSRDSATRGAVEPETLDADTAGGASF